MSTVSIATGSLYIFSPDGLSQEVRPHVYALHSGVDSVEFASDGYVIFGFLMVPYPVEQTRYTLAHLCQQSHQRGMPVYWSWVPPIGAVVHPGGTLSLRCREGSASVIVSTALQSWFPGAYLYTFPATEQGWVFHDVDTPCPDKALYARYVSLARQVPSVELHWRRWFDRVELPDGNIVMVGED